MYNSTAPYGCLTCTATALHSTLVHVAVSGRYVEKISALPFLCAERSFGSVIGFLEISARNKPTPQNRHQNFRFARIHGVTCPSVRRNTTHSTCNMWNNILVSDSAYRLNFERSKTFRNLAVLPPSDEHEASRVGFRNVVLSQNVWRLRKSKRIKFFY